MYIVIFSHENWHICCSSRGWSHRGRNLSCQSQAYTDTLTNTSGIAMVVQQFEIKCRTQVQKGLTDNVSSALSLRQWGIVKKMLNIPFTKSDK